MRQFEEELTPQEQPQPQSAKRGKSKGCAATLIVGAILAIAAIGIGVYFFLQYKHQEQQEAEAFEALQSSNSSADFASFLERFPQSEHQAVVKERYEQLKTVEEAWMKIRQSSNIVSFQHFRKNCSEPFYLALCDQKIDSLDWVSAQKENTLESYTAYTAVHPEGLYVAEATLLMEKLEKSTLTATEEEQVQTVLNNFFRYLGSNSQNAMASTITPVMSRFLTKKNATKADVMNMMDQMFNEHIYYSAFRPNGDYVITREGIDTPEPYYKATFTVDQYIQRDDEGKTFGNYQVTAELDSHLKVRMLTMNEISRR
ncbi:MAG: hypothetical protein IJ553_00975 [Alloprevotella sp.]|nr:hypothetical protein [Alloprevotella sp.]